MRPALLPALLSARCPHCRRGKIFRSLMAMHKQCDVCGIVYEREHGYFLNSIFVGYLIYGLILAPTLLFGYFTDRLIIVMIPTIIAIALLSPFVFRYARVIWMYVDEAIDPRPEPLP